MIYFYVKICDKTPGVMILDSGVLRTRYNLRGNCKRHHSLIVLVNRYGIYWFFEKTTQYRQSVSLEFEYKINFLHKNHKR